jgi:hypothetical protein
VTIDGTAGVQSTGAWQQLGCGQQEDVAPGAAEARGPQLCTRLCIVLVIVLL